MFKKIIFLLCLYNVNGPGNALVDEYFENSKKIEMNVFNDIKFRN